jgi:pimeloyl-ACP methyl ester carboxylesterase
LKNLILVCVLVSSILLNAAGIVFFILFLTEHAHYKSLRREKASLQRNLGMVASGTRIAEAVNSDQIARSIFVSHLDGQADTYAFQAPQLQASSLDYTLVVYLHGMGSSYLEPFVAHPTQTASIAQTLSSANPTLGIISSNYRNASWGNDAATSDIIQNIREVMQRFPFKRIVLMGTSMGGCVALNLAATAPEDIRSKLAGVVSMESAGDLITLWTHTKDKAIRPAILLALGGTPEQATAVYRKKSFLTNIDGLPHTARVFLVSARQDRVIPPELQKEVAQALVQHLFANRLVEIDGDHGAPPLEFYVKGLRYVLGDNNI